MFQIATSVCPILTISFDIDVNRLINTFKTTIMRKLKAFNFITLNGYFKGANGDLNWHKHGYEEHEYAEEGLNSESTLLFGRVTYEMMAFYWPSQMALEKDHIVAKGMNSAEKIVFSRSLNKADWNNTRLIKNNMIDELRLLKSGTGKDLTILGSGSIITQCAEEGLIDEFEIMLDPVAICDGTPIFNGIKHTLNFKLIKTRVFKSGVVLLSYKSI